MIGLRDNPEPPEEPEEDEEGDFMGHWESTHDREDWD